jgi:hypothetical protein
MHSYGASCMHFRQYLYRNHFVLRTDHKPPKWLATVSEAHGRRGRWIDMLQDFSFKIVHRPGLRHTNVDALSRNLVGPAMEDDDFCEEIQDIGNAQTDTHTWKKGSSSLFRLAQRWNGSESEERTGSQYNIIPVVLGSTTLCASVTTICM